MRDIVVCFERVLDAEEGTYSTVSDMEKFRLYVQYLKWSEWNHA